jgi:phosphoesterase RecJ-like protein
LEQIVEIIKNAKTIYLSTHRQCDGDGLGAELALYHALKKQSKKVSIINLDPTPKKYSFLQPDKHIQYWQETQSKLEPADLVLIFDTNDKRLLGDLYPQFEAACSQIVFIDHHPLLSHGPNPTKYSFIDIKAASTGEICFDIIEQLGIPLDTEISRCLYTSITFDTQLYRYIRNSPRSHMMAARLLEFPIDSEMIHRALFAQQTAQKMAFLAKALGQIEYYENGLIALLKVQAEDLKHYKLDFDESRDVIDMIMNIDILEVAVLIREDNDNQYKLSFRSKGKYEVLHLAESFGGGGHTFSSGAYIVKNYDQLKEEILKNLCLKFK